MSHRALFLGTPSPTVAATLSTWIAAGNKIAAFWYAAQTEKQWRRDRRLGLLAPQWSVSAILRDNGITPTAIPLIRKWTDRLDAARAADADVMVSVYFPNVVPGDLLAEFPRRAVNLHPALLPHYRGPSPTTAMILDRTVDSETGVTLHLMNERLDEGDIIAQQPVSFPQDRDIAALDVTIAQTCGRLIATELPRFLAGEIEATPQSEEHASYIRLQSDAFVLSSALHAEDVRWRLETLGRYRPFTINGHSDQRVMGFSRVLSPPTGAPLRSALTTVDIDVADARVRLRKKNFWTRRMAKSHRALLLRRAPVWPESG